MSALVKSLLNFINRYYHHIMVNYHIYPYISRKMLVNFSPSKLGVQLICGSVNLHTWRMGDR